MKKNYQILEEEVKKLADELRGEAPDILEELHEHLKVINSCYLESIKEAIQEARQNYKVRYEQQKS